jgi:PAS domain S-box-containing protein
MPETGNGHTLADETGKADGVTEMRRQEALLKTGALQNAILSSANFSSIATDENGVIQIFNVGAERMLGYTAADVLNKITPADISDPQEVIARAKALSLELTTTIRPGFEALVFKASRGIEDIYELTYIRKDGSRFPAVVSVTALRDAQDAIIGYLLIGTDNTARKQVEAERQHLLEIQEETNKKLQQANVTLLDSEEKLAVTLNSIGDAVIATDAAACVTLLNPLAERLTGWTHAQATGRPVGEIFHILNQETRQPAAIPVMETLAKGTIQGMANHTVLVARGGSECAIADSCAPIRDRDGKVIGAVLVFRDVTGEYAAQQALRDSAALIQTILNTVVDGIITIHSRGGIIETVNPAAERMFGYTAADLIGQNFGLLIPELDQDRHHGNGSLEYYSASAEARASGLGREVAGRRQDGSVFPMEMAVSEMWLGGQRYFTGILRDITVRKQVEAERTLLDQALQDKNAELESARFVAEKANLAKSDFLSSMSHELRTPLNAILGFAQLMESGSPPPSPSQKRNLEQILKAGWYLLELINEILDLALIESGKMTLSHEPVSLVEVMLECRAMIEPQAQKRGIGMTFPRFESPYFVSADRTRVKQVLINLLFNAIKYNKPEGTVAVEYVLCAPDSIRISVRDSGAGLAPEQLAQLFQPFNRLGKEDGAEEGTGIGLVVTKRLVELMGGTIGADSTLGVGSVFWFELRLTTAPLLAVREAGHAALMRPQAAEGTPLRTVLYVEDNPANLELVEQLIARRPDLRLLSASDGNLGIEFARVYQPEVILMDINLPGISGIEAMKILHADPLTAHIPIIALSANAVPHDIEKALQAGFFNYLTKPIKVNQFMDALDVALKLAKTAAETKAGRSAEKEPL